jgi:hypothetical protein
LRKDFATILEDRGEEIVDEANQTPDLTITLNRFPVDLLVDLLELSKMGGKYV